MTPSPDIQPLSRLHRRLVFLMTIVLFCVGVPALVFYAVGYRLDLSSPDQNIKTVGGMYISADADEIEIFIQDEPVEDMRFFLNAAYIQNLDEGMHSLRVQGDAIATWVKYLPVYAHFVTEAVSFNMPTKPNVRLVTQYETAAGLSVIDHEATTTFAFASTTNTLYATSSQATSTYSVNPEYVYLETLFASTTEERLRIAEADRKREQRFHFPGEATSSTSTLEVATSTRVQDNILLYEESGDLYARWEGTLDNTPYYFCVTYSGTQQTIDAYGVHVYEDIRSEYEMTGRKLADESDGSYICRDTIRIDRKQQSIQYFDFLPGSSHLVMLQLQDGVYVVEIDDRSWQNVQLLYPGDFLEVVIDSGSIFIKDGAYLLEVFTELQG